jgi:two-component system, LytTR family, sensor kinase
MIKLPRYTKKQDTRILFSVLCPAVIALNLLLFGLRYFTEFRVFVLATIVTFSIMAASWLAHTWVAVTLRNRFSNENDLALRVFIAIFLFIIMTGLTLSLLFWGYDSAQFLGYQINENRYEWALIIGAIANIFVTFLHEGVSSFEKWRTTLKETEQLKKEYMHSQLLGLKSQVNPHFLFNSLNSLSSLINENQEEAERFLDEMSMVYRYLLRSSEEQLVTLEAELQFISSYYYMLKVRYRDAVELVVNVDAEKRNKFLPPLTLQIVLESAFNLNTICKEMPLKIEISISENGWLQIKNNIQKKICDTCDNTGLENITNKFRLLSQQSLLIKDNEYSRIIQLPLLNHQETVVA